MLLPLSVLQKTMTRMVSYRFLPIGALALVILSSTVFVMLPAAVSNQHQSAFATFPGENGKIAFVSSSEIYVMNPDGSGVTRLTDTPANDGYPSWSPDGTKIAFQSNRDGNNEIYVMNSNGSDVTRLTDYPSNDLQPEWSPDGTKIAFVRSGGGGSEIYVMNPDGSDVTRLTDTRESTAHPDWSPDGTKIAFASTTIENFRFSIFVMNSDGSDVRELVSGSADHLLPDWSPDGTKIAFQSNRYDHSYTDIYVMNPDGSDVTRLSGNSDVDDSYPSWSPDGTKIAFQSNRDDGHDHIYVMNSNGSDVTRLSDVPGRYLDWGTATPTDTTPPVITVPNDITEEATSPDGAEVTYTVTAQDNVDGNATLEEDGSITQDDVGGDINISCEPASGTTFPIGNTTVDCSATDEAGNTGTESFTVTVNAPQPPPPEEDTTPPVLTVPEDIVVEANSEQGAQITYSVTAQDNVDGNATLEEDGITVTQDDVGGNITISCNPPSGSVFPVGDTEVECNATDEAGNEATASFTVTVNPPTPSPPPIPPQIIDKIISTIQNLDDNVPQSVKTSLIAVLNEVSNILGDINPNNDESACDKLGAFINQVNAAAERRNNNGTMTADQADDLRTQADDIRDELLVC